MKKPDIYPQTNNSPEFPKIEKKILEFWNKNNIFEKSILNRSNNETKNNEFVFYDGPPFANGLPHYGHLLTGFIKDLYGRFQTLKGKKVERKFGWDCHGLPAEMEAEKELKIQGRNQITEFGIDKFNQHCSKSVMKYQEKWEEYVNRQARWVDFKNSYKTMDLNFMESVIWAFKTLYDKGLIYESKKVMPYSWACETPLSNFETRLDNSYRQRTDKAVTLGFELDLTDNKIASLSLEKNQFCKILAWTTTPWTLPSNLALAVHKDIEYSLLLSNNNYYIVGKFALTKYSQEMPNHQLITTLKGSELVGLKYQPVFDYFKNHTNSFKIIEADFVTESDGTGIVHMAPGFGEEDRVICEANKIELVCPINNAGCFTDEIYDLSGVNVFDANDQIIIKLKKQGNWIKTEQYLHNYPHCWRTDTPLIYKAVSSWYVKVSSFKDKLCSLNQQINWIPGYIKDGLFGKWLENAHDWSISRNRFWGTPIPVWVSDDPINYPRIDVYGSIADLERDFNVKIKDLHRPFIDLLERPNPNDPTGKSKMRRIEDVFDCWFESGSMPYGQVHYPFENKEWFETHFPADFIVEYTAQTRGWFYTLLVLSTALFEKPPFLNCICHGVILDIEGRKLSKRLNNYPDPMEIFDKYGSDALRFTMISSPVVNGNEFLIDKEGEIIFDTVRLVLNPIWNSYNFFSIYANIDQIKACSISTSSNILDLYILAKLKTAIMAIDTSLSAFDSQAAGNIIRNFFKILNNWYIRRSKDRFTEKSKNPDEQQNKIAAYNTLYTCLHNIAIAISPMLPLISEYIYLNINPSESNVSSSLGNTNHIKESVHLEYFANQELLNAIADKQTLVATMDYVIEICSTALFVRSQHNIRIRQPLEKLIIATDSEEYDILDLIHLIKEEVNVKEVILESKIEKYAKEKISLNLPAIGKRIPHKVQEIIKQSKLGNWKKIVKQDASIELILADIQLLEEEFSSKLEPLSGQGKALTGYKGVIILDTNINEELYKEGLARDLIRSIQQARKDQNFLISQKAFFNLITTSLKMKEIWLKHQDSIALQLNLILVDSDLNNQDLDWKEIEVNLDVDAIVKLRFAQQM